MTRPSGEVPFVLERRVDTPDGAGGVVSAWQAQGTLWGVLKARTGRERLEGEAGVGTLSYVVSVRGVPHGAPSRPTIRDRLRQGERIFDVVSVAEADPLGRRLACLVIGETGA